MPKFAALVVGMAAIGAATCSWAQTLKLTDCRLEGVAGIARCGSVAVAENPDKPGGRRLDIAIAVLPATGKARLDPIVPLNGGPGEDVISGAAYFAERLASLRGNRDILLVDQRGTGKSNRLACRLHDAANPSANLQDLFPREAVRACARELGQRADLTQYSYLHFAHDLESVRRALGYGKLNLFSGSYGTRAAQVIVRNYPDSVRTVYLGSVVPIDEVAPLTMAKASQAIFERTFDACAADAGCTGAYPNIRDEFDEILKRLDAGSVRVPVPGAPDGVRLERGRVVEWMRSRLYRPSSAAQLPRLIHGAFGGNWSPIVEGILAQARDFDAAYGGGLFFSITCAEDMAFLQERDIAAASAGTYLGDYRVRQQQAACHSWPNAILPSGYRHPVRSSVPTMFVSGDTDAASPLWLTAHAASGFSNRVEIVARGQGHTEWSECLGRLYREFIESGAASGIDALRCPPVPRPPFATQ